MEMIVVRQRISKAQTRRLQDRPRITMTRPMAATIVERNLLRAKAPPRRRMRLRLTTLLVPLLAAQLQIAPIMPRLLPLRFRTKEKKRRGKERTIHELNARILRRTGKTGR
jgi:hypothetical protein